MLDIQFIKENKSLIERAIKNRNKPSVNLDRVIELYDKRTRLIGEIDNLNKKRKEVSSEQNIEMGREIKEELKVKEAELKTIMQEFIKLMGSIPNIPLPDVPIGKDESGNVVLREEGERTKFSFEPKPHWELGKSLNVIDTERGVKVAGSRFSFLLGDLVKMQFGILKLILDISTNEDEIKKIISENNLDVSSKPFVPVLPPNFIKPEMLYGMGRLDPRDDKFFLDKDNLFLAGSAEHTLGSMHANEIFQEKDLPIRYIGYGTAFRREAGSYGKDTRGIIRQHQFDKAEFESFTTPETSKSEQDLLLSIQEEIVKRLQLPYRVVSICTGDMGGPDQRQIDIEAWMPGQGVYREITTADLLGSFQTRRLGIKVERKGGEKEYVHTNDATAAAMGRLLASIMENYQTESGEVLVPEVLKESVGGEKITPQ